MGKNHRHKKNLKAEKAKVKLKQTKTKFLPKGLNVTNTTFKIKPIVLPEQLKEKKHDVPLSKRKLNANDLLNRLKHYNENIRHDACVELSEMIKIHTEEIIQQHLSQICLSISGLMQDRERKVRKIAAKTIVNILEHVPDEKLRPFFGYFSTNLRCAMTNIDKNVQEDSLQFLDCFIRLGCSLINKSSEKLLPDFFTLISKLRNDSNLERTLTVNLGSKMTSITWRIKVLSRLHAVLTIILGGDEIHGEINKMETNDCTFDSNSNWNFPINKEKFMENLEKHSFDVFGNTRRCNNNNNNNDRYTDIINRHVLTLIPLLYETWLEVVPEKKNNKNTHESTVISSDAASILACIMNTLYLLWQYVAKFGKENLDMKTVFLTNDGRKFFNHLLTNFPYCQTGQKTKQKNSQNDLKSIRITEENNDPKCLKENLLICFLYSILFVNNSQNNIRNEMGLVTSYITRCFFNKSCVSETTVRYLVEFLKECIGKNYQKWRNSGVEMKTILENAIFFHDHSNISETSRAEIFEILIDVIDIEFFNRNETYQRWLSSLPDILCRNDVSATIVSSLLRISKRNNKIFYEAFKRKIKNVLGNLDKLKITSCDSEDDVKRNVINMFYYLPRFNEEESHLISDYINQNPESCYTLYMSQVLQLRQELKNY